MLVVPGQDNSYKTNGTALQRNSVGLKGTLGAPLISPTLSKKQIPNLAPAVSGSSAAGKISGGALPVFF